MRKFDKRYDEGAQVFFNFMIDWLEAHGKIKEGHGHSRFFARWADVDALHDFIQALLGSALWVSMPHQARKELGCFILLAMEENDQLWINHLDLFDELAESCGNEQNNLKRFAVVDGGKSDTE